MSLSLLKRPQDSLSEIAESQLGLAEWPKGSNSGPAIKKFFEADDLVIGGKTDGYPWCAAFVDWCVQQWLLRQSSHAPQIKAPRTAAAYGLEDWAKANQLQVIPGITLGVNRPMRGDIVIYSFSHTGVICAVHQDSPIFSAVEGNTNDDGSREGYEVATRARTFAVVRSVIRLPGKALSL